MAENLEVLSPAHEETAPGLEPPWPMNARLPLWCGIAVLTAAGCLGIYRDIFILWTTWTTDPLRSIGMLIPLASIVLTLRVWRQEGWKLRGTWWGLLVIGFSYFLSVLRAKLLFLVVLGGTTVRVPVIPTSVPVYVYASGVVLLFAGTQVWRKAWFPLSLLLLSQPVPGWTNELIDIPLQNISAHVARSFATLIHFAPTTPQLRLMFSPDFGMFIAPGCNGIRGAVTMGYVALILGYLKRVSWRRWVAYVGGAVLLGYVFNFIRLCVLVVYYRIALGHPALEGVAKQADYGIGSCLFLIAMFLLLRLARHEQQNPIREVAVPDSAMRRPRIGAVYIKCAAFALTLLIALSLPSSALKYRQAAKTTPTSFAALMPKRIGGFTLTRTWYEQTGGITVEENGAYSAPGSDEIILGVWVTPFFYAHNANDCWLARGLQPDILTTRQFLTADGESRTLNTGFYSDGITENIVVNAVCTPGSCLQFQPAGSSKRMGFLFLEPQVGELAGSGQHPVSIMIRIDKLHSSTQKSANYDLLANEAQTFLAGLDPTSLSKAFQ